MITLEALRSSTQDGLLSVCARANGARVGVALADIRSVPGLAKVRAIVIIPAYRGRGIGRQLVQALERHARAHGAKRIEAMYERTQRSAGVIGSLLGDVGWTETPFSAHVLYASTHRIIEAPWMGARIPREYQFFGWTELIDRDRPTLAAADDAGAYPAGLGPLPASAIEPACSIGVRWRGDVVGWMLTQRIAPDLVRYNRLFVACAHRTRLSGVALLAEAIRRQHRAGIPRGTFAVSSGNLPMMRIVARRIEPFADTRTELRCAAKRL